MLICYLGNRDLVRYVALIAYMIATLRQQIRFRRLRHQEAMEPYISPANKRDSTLHSQQRPYQQTIQTIMTVVLSRRIPGQAVSPGSVSDCRGSLATRAGPSSHVFAARWHSTSTPERRHVFHVVRDMRLCFYETLRECGLYDLSSGWGLSLHLLINIQHSTSNILYLYSHTLETYHLNCTIKLHKPLCSSICPSNEPTKSNTPV